MWLIHVGTFTYIVPVCYVLCDSRVEVNTKYKIKAYTLKKKYLKKIYTSKYILIRLHFYLQHHRNLPLLLYPGTCPAPTRLFSAQLMKGTRSVLTLITIVAEIHKAKEILLTTFTIIVTLLNSIHP